MEKENIIRIYVEPDGLFYDLSIKSFDDIIRRGRHEAYAPKAKAISLVKAMNKIPNIQVNILSYIPASAPYYYDEKLSWLNKYLSDIPNERIYLPFMGTETKEAIGRLSDTDYLFTPTRSGYELKKLTVAHETFAGKVLSLNIIKDERTLLTLIKEYVMPPAKDNKVVINVKEDEIATQSTKTEAQNQFLSEDNDAVQPATPVKSTISIHETSPDIDVETSPVAEQALKTKNIENAKAKIKPNKKNENRKTRLSKTKRNTPKDVNLPSKVAITAMETARDAGRGISGLLRLIIFLIVLTLLAIGLLAIFDPETGNAFVAKITEKAKDIWNAITGTG